LAIAIALATTPFVSAFAQNAGNVAPQGAAKPADPGSKKVLGLADIGRWNRIANAALSADGKWMTYVITPNEGDGTLYVRQLDGSTTHNDSCRLGARVLRRFALRRLLRESAERGRGGRRRAGGGRGQAPGGAAPVGSPPRRFELLDLATGDKSFRVADAATFKFSKGSTFLACSHEQGKRSPQSTTAQT
jgi:hypothetical protein